MNKPVVTLSLFLTFALLAMVPSALAYNGDGLVESYTPTAVSVGSDWDLTFVLYNDAAYVPQALFNAGQLLEKQGRAEEAIKAYQEIVNKYPDSEMIEKAKKELEGIRAK